MDIESTAILANDFVVKSTTVRGTRTFILADGSKARIFQNGLVIWSLARNVFRHEGPIALLPDGTLIIRHSQKQSVAIKDGRRRVLQTCGDPFGIEFNDGRSGFSISTRGELRFYKMVGKRPVSHRDDGPAYLDLSTDYWYQEGLLHRDGQPAIVAYDEKTHTQVMRQEWYFRGMKHRDDGPAVTLVNGHNQYWYAGVQQDPATFLISIGHYDEGLRLL